VRARWERLLAGSLSERNIRKQRPYDGFEFSKMQFVGGLKIQPGLRIGAEVVLETYRRISGDPAPLADDFIYPSSRYAQRTRPRVR
jgi:hypothetical protein